MGSEMCIRDSGGGGIAAQNRGGGGIAAQNRGGKKSGSNKKTADEYEDEFEKEEKMLARQRKLFEMRRATGTVFFSFYCMISC